MGTTSEFIKLRSSKTPKAGEWNINYADALAKAKKDGKFIIAVWSNGDNCGHCVNAEKCMMTATFKNWMKDANAYFVFQYSGDKDKGKTVHDWVYSKETKIKQYPGFRITRYDQKTGKIVYDQAAEGTALRNSKTGENGAKAMVSNLEAMLSSKPDTLVPESDESTSGDYKIRLNEKLTVKKVNAILDAIDKNDGYCPCQAGKSADTKCHCKDFKENKKIGEPCICNIYVKQKK